MFCLAFMGNFASNAFVRSIATSEILEESYLERIDSFVLFCAVVLFE